jgi:Asp-tRNA(Asn)/Glu-tRNA(Gln) amidotransferase A subunit family amidase
MVSDLYKLTAREVVRRVADGSVTTEALVMSQLERIAEIEPAIGAWQYLDEGQARASAALVDATPNSGPLRGLPIGVKDVIATSDMPTSFGSAIYANFRAPYDASCVALSRAAGAMVLGKTVSTEFAAAAPGITRNPYNLDHTPGGSSSGSAAAVAAKMVAIAFGTQTAGSTIRPAAFCGVVGYKPTFGFIDTSGVKALAPGLDTIGIMGRNVADVAFVAAHITARPELQMRNIVNSPRIGLYRTEAQDQGLPEAWEAIERTIQVLARDGVQVEEIPLMAGYDDLLSTYQDLFNFSMVRALSYEHRFLTKRISPVTLQMLDKAADSASPERYDRAVARAREARTGMERLFGDFDAILTLPASGEAPVGLQSTGNSDFNRSWTMLHVPCVTVPAGRGPNDLPVGVQIVGRRGDDARTLEIAARIEAVVDFH